MKTAFRESFDADLSALADPALFRRIKRVIEQVEAARTFQQISNLKRLEASGKYYRIQGCIKLRSTAPCSADWQSAVSPTGSRQGRKLQVCWPF